MNSPTFAMNALRLCLILVPLLVSGCSSVPFPTYAVSGSNVSTIRSIPAAISVGEFSGSQGRVSCRAQRIEPEGGATFGAFIQDAFNNEVLIAGEASGPKMEIRGLMREVAVACGISEGSWTIEAEISINNGPPFTARTVRNFEGSFAGVIVYQRAFQAFVPAVQDFVSYVLNSPQVRAATSQ